MLRKKLFYLFSATITSLTIWLYFLFHVDPTYADILIWIAFMASLFFWLSGFLGFIIFYLKINFYNQEIIYSLLPTSLRQASEISLIIVGLLSLQSLKVLGWWEGGLYILVILLLEMFFQTKPFPQQNLSHLKTKKNYANAK